MGVLMKPMDVAWAVLKADPDRRAYRPINTHLSFSQTRHPGPKYRPSMQLVTQKDTVSDEYSPYDIFPMDTVTQDGKSRANFGYRGAKPGVSESNRDFIEQMYEKNPDTWLNALQVLKPNTGRTPKNIADAFNSGGGFDRTGANQYGEISPQSKDSFEEIFQRFMEQQGRKGNPDNVQMLPGNVMQYV